MLPAEAARGRRGSLIAPRALIPALAAALVLALAGCGDAGDDEDGTTQPPAGGYGGGYGPPADAGGAASSFTVTLDADGPGGEPAQEAEVECAGDADDAACELVAELPDAPTAPTPPDMACTEIYGGPDTLVVSGTLRGDEVDARFTRGNGCEIDRFERFLPLLEELFPGYRPGSAIGP